LIPVGGGKCKRRALHKRFEIVKRGEFVRPSLFRGSLVRPSQGIQAKRLSFWRGLERAKKLNHAYVGLVKLGDPVYGEAYATFKVLGGYALAVLG